MMMPMMKYSDELQYSCMLDEHTHAKLRSCYLTLKILLNWDRWSHDGMPMEWKCCDPKHFLLLRSFHLLQYIFIFWCMTLM